VNLTYELNEEEKKIWEFIKKKPATLKTIARKFNLTTEQARIRLKNIERAGKPLKKERVGNKGVYLYSCASSIEDIVLSVYNPPMQSFDKPEVIPLKNPPDFSIGFANTIFAGGKTNKKMFKNFLHYLETKKADALVIPGNLIWIDITKYSKYKPDRALSSELERDVSKIEYPKSVREAGKDPEKILEEKKPLYLTFKEKLDIVIERALKPLFYDENNKPIYNGPIYVTFGEMEEELARQQANEGIRIEKKKDLEAAKAHISELKGELKALRREIKNYEKNMTEENINEEELNKLMAKYEKCKIKEEELLQQIADWNDYIARITMTNVDENFINLKSNAIKGYIINRIESAIPNCKVISTGDGYIKAGDKVIKIMYSANKVSNIISDNLMDKLVEAARMHLSQGIEAPDFIVAGGLSTTYTFEPIAYVDKNGEKTTYLIQLPTCLNEKSLEEILQSKVRAGKNSMLRLATIGNFNSGALVIEYVDGIQRREFLTSEFLTNDEVFNKGKIEYSLFYEVTFSDQHHGSKYVTLIETEDDVKYAFEVAQELLKKINAPIVKINMLGDELQEKNYDTEAENHPEYLYPKQLERKIKELEKKYGKDSVREIKKLIKKNTIRAGIIPPQKQKFDFLDIIDYEWLKKVIENARKVKLKGPIINIINGNHNVHTFEGLVNTSEDIAREFRIRTGATEKEVMAPILGKSGVYAGTFGIEGHYQWGEYCRHKQGGSKNSKDPMRSMRRAFERRGQDFSQLKDKYIINRAAHDHRGGQTTSKNVFHDKSYCFMDRNEYGENLDFGSPTRGFKINGLPIDGPKYGPIVSIEFPIEYLKKWAREKPKINIEKLFKNTYKPNIKR